MLDGYGIHTLAWDSADERLGDFLVASPADATGRGLELHVRQGGAAADLTGASVYFLWRHKMAGTRGCEPMAAIDTSLGQFIVYYPAAMQEEKGAVDAQCMVSWDDKSISTRAFTIRVEPVLIGGEEHEDGFTLFVDAILDGTDAGGYQAQPYMVLESGVLSESVFADIADAIRGQNGLSTRYQPGDMAAAILALEWDVGLKPRAVLTSLGTLEFNYVDGRYCHDGGVPVNAWEIDPAGYSSATARPYDDIKLRVRKVVIHSSWAQVGMTNANYLFNSFQNMTEVSGFENLSGIMSANQMFTSCPALETIYATSFSNSGLSGSLMFNGRNRLVGGTDGFVPSSTSGASVCKLGAGGVLTDPNADGRHWFWAHYYADGEGVLTASATPESGRELVASGRVCAEAKYVGLGFTPWDGVTGPTHREHLTSAKFAADMAAFSYLNFQYLFYSCTNLASVSGLGNLCGVRSMRFMFASAAVATLDFRGFDPSALTDLYYAFSGCKKLTTIYADAGWALPSSGVSGSQRFYNCSTSLVGGNGTVWASSKTAYTYFRIDTASTPGYITAA